MSATAAPPIGRPVSRPAARPRPSEQRINVGNAERWLSLLGGGALGLFGLSRRSVGGLALAAVGGALAYRGATGHSSLYQALDVSTARRPRTSVPAASGYKLEQSVTINRPPRELFSFWRDFSNLPRFMSHLNSVQSEGPRSHWVARAPLGMSVSWDAEIINERPDELIAWRSLPGSAVDTAGSVHFREAHGRGTEVRVTLKYDPPGGKVGSWAAWVFGASPEQQVREDLRRFKQIMEAGEAPTTAGQPVGRCR